MNRDGLLNQSVNGNGRPTLPGGATDAAGHDCSHGQTNGRSQTHGAGTQEVCLKCGSRIITARGGVLVNVHADEHGHVDREHLAVPLDHLWR